jgi:hypothetical protein
MRKTIQVIKQSVTQPFFIKLFNWEYWPFSVVYVPIYLYWFWLSIRARSFFFFNASNPTIKNGGFLQESKKEIYDLIPGKYYPKTLFFYQDVSENDLLRQMQLAGLVFPLIGKPDIGMRGLAVKKLDTVLDVLQYARDTRVSFLLQEFIPFENEVGIFYYRLPGETKGHITGIVGKEFLTVSGDGISTIEELLKQDKRFILQLNTLRATFAGKLQKVLDNGEKYLMVPYGNHCRGAKFIDVSKLIDEELLSTIDEVCRQIPGFYFGRMDVRYNTWEELKQGRNFSIVELNGAGSEPTHMYDPEHSIFFAWKEIIRHLNILLQVSILNHRAKQVPYMSLYSGLQMIRENSAYVKMLDPVKPEDPFVAQQTPFSRSLK